MIRPVDPAWIARAWARHDQLTKPPRSLGRLEEAGVRLAAIQQRERPTLGRAIVVVCAADHGVTAEGVSAYPAEVTRQMVGNFLGGGAAINQLAAIAGAEVRVVDAGVSAASPEHPALTVIAGRRCSGNIAGEPAMTRSEALDLLDAGRRLAREAADAGGTVLAVGDMGIGNTTAAAALTCALLGVSPEAATGRGTGVDENRRAHKVAVVARAIDRARGALGPLPEADPVDVLAHLGGLELAAVAGVVLGGAEAGLPVVTDGFPVTSGALVAARIDPAVSGYLFAGHRSVEPGHARQLDALGLRPLLDLELRLGEGTGAVLAIPVLRAAAAVLAGMATFAEAGVSDA